MKKILTLTLLTLALAGASLALAAQTARPQADAVYMCPATGEPLPCPACCPLK
ncbi:MAG: hypothetical protein HY706_13970 [Candidatus Hydrogenedentes bacterium]|nr:hypothetical protein [Candidatus Hydrogenedentota bacterium]